MESQQILYRYVTSDGEGVWSAGKRLLPPNLADEANENRKWLVKPTLPDGNYRFYMTQQGKQMYENTLLKTHIKYLKGIKPLEIPKPTLGEIVYEDEFQVVEKIPET